MKIFEITNSPNPRAPQAPVGSSVSPQKNPYKQKQQPQPQLNQPEDEPDMADDVTQQQQDNQDDIETTLKNATPTKQSAGTIDKLKILKAKTLKNQPTSSQ